MKKIKLTIAGLSFTQTQTGAYVLILSEDDGDRRLPVVIGNNEAQAIAIQLEGLKPYRPLTHDLFLSLAAAYRIELTEINITRLEEGIFFSELVCKRKDAIVKIDARTSDAVALAIRFKCPIFVVEDVMKRAAVYIDSEGKLRPFTEQERDEEKKNDAGDIFEKFMRKHVKMDFPELEKLMKQAASEEDYEKASLIRDIIRAKKGEQTDLDISEYID